VSSGFQLTQTKHEELLRLATGNGHWDVVLFIVENLGIKTDQEEMFRLYKDLFNLRKLAQSGDISGILQLIVTWRDDEEKALAVSNGAPVSISQSLAEKWKMAVEMAVEKGDMELIMTLLDCRLDEVSSVSLLLILHM
jgi:hypothetical protein